MSDDEVVTEADKAITALQTRCDALEDALRTLVAWLGQSAISPLSMHETLALLGKLPLPPEELIVDDGMVCIGCGCTMTNPCDDGEGGTCYWVYTDKEAETGLCSECLPKHGERWHKGERMAPGDFS